MELRWSAARTTLRRIAESGPQIWTPLSSQETESLNQFSTLYVQHMVDEEQIVYPAARSFMVPGAIEVMSQDMMHRRGVR